VQTVLVVFFAGSQKVRLIIVRQVWLCVCYIIR